MPFRVTRNISFSDEVEILKFPVGLNATKSVVLNAQKFDVNTQNNSVRVVVPVGTILMLSSTGVEGQYEEYDGSGSVAGILAHNVDLAAATTEGAEPVPMYFHGCVFATTAIVGFTQYASDLVNDLPTCKFE